MPWHLRRMSGSRGNIARLNPIVPVTPWYLKGGIAASNCVAAYKAKGAASYAESKVNLINPGTNDATDGAAFPTWAAATGWTFDGATQYLTTGVIPTDSYTAIFRYANVTPAANKTIFGVWNSGTTATFLCQATAADTIKTFHGDGASWYIDNTATSPNVYAVAGKLLYLAGIYVNTCAAGVAGGAYLQIYIGALNLDGVASQFTAVDILALSIYSVSLTAPQVLAVSTAMAGL